MFNGFRDLVPGASGEITVLVKNISTMKMKNGDRCQKISVRDVDGMEMTFMKFDGLMNIELPAVMTLDIDCTPKDSGMLPKITNFNLAENVDASYFKPHAKIDPEKGWKMVNYYIKQLDDSTKVIVKEMLTGITKEYTTRAFGESGPFARKSGVLEATLKLARMAEKATDIYGFNKSILMAGALLYYVGNVLIMNTDYSASKYQTLCGANALAYQRLMYKMSLLRNNEEKKESAKLVKDEDIDLLANILLSKNSRYNDEASPAPAIPEALCLLHLNRLICDLDRMDDVLNATESGNVSGEYRGYRRAYKSECTEKKDDEPVPDTGKEEQNG